MYDAQKAGGPALTQAWLKSLVSPHTVLVLDSVRAATRLLNEMARCAPECYKDWSHTGVATVFNDLVCKQIARRSSGVAGLEIVVEETRYLLVVDGVVRFRFKQVDAFGTSRNYPTRRQEELYSRPQTVKQLSLDPTKFGPDRYVQVLDLTIGWVWDKTRTSIEDIQVVYAPGHLLNFSIMDRGDGDGITLIAPSASPTEPPATTARAVVRRRKQEDKAS